MDSPRQKIHLLPDALINKIAAGEVVERPASVVKELLENALDARATRISIAVEDGGRTLIRVSDDGSGIPPEEAALAFAQHATSKIASVDDLFAIATMGFRGEALASIASVSHASMVTRTRNADQGVRIEVKDSVASPPMPCAAPAGTTIEVRDLFYSVPGRRKFLKTDGTEFSHLYEMVLRSAMPNPQVAFTLTHDGRVVLELAATTDHRLRVAEALGGGPGEEARTFYESLLPIHFADERTGREGFITLTGFAGQPASARPTNKYQYMFLNGRYIRDRSLLHAMKEAYRGLIEPASQPMGALFLAMDPALFDVNVHPQKIEVRFRDSGSVYRAVLVGLREKLLGSDLTPMMKTEGRASGQWPVVSGQNESGTTSTREMVANFFKQALPIQPRLHFGVETGPSVMDDPSRITIGHGQTEDPRDGNPGLSPSPTMPASFAQTPAKDESKIENQPSGPQATDHSPRFVQVHNTYIVAETGEGLIVIDQHALHERIIYEELFARATRGQLEGQRLLIPEILPINPRQAAALEGVRPLLLRLGIEVTDFDSGSLAVHSFPSLLSKVNPREFIRDLLDRLMEYGSSGGTKLSPEELLHEVLDMASCKAAVKAGYPLSQEEIAALLTRKEQIERSSNCPHGRPTTLRLTINDLERQFKRK